MRTAIAILGALTPILVAAQVWTHEKTQDEFTDETVWIASVDDSADEQHFTLFVNCREGGPVNVGLTGTYMNPVGGKWAGEMKYYSIPTRVDDEKPIEHDFAEQGPTLFLTSNQQLRKLLAELGESEMNETIEKRGRQILVKKLAEGNRLRIKFPQHGGAVVLDFPLNGSRVALLETVEGCAIPAAGGTDAFRDAEGTEYTTLAEMLKDAT